MYWVGVVGMSCWSQTAMVMRHLDQRHMFHISLIGVPSVCVPPGCLPRWLWMVGRKYTNAATMNLLRILILI